MTSRAVGVADWTGNRKPLWAILTYHARYPVAGRVLHPTARKLGFGSYPESAIFSLCAPLGFHLLAALGNFCEAKKMITRTHRSPSIPCANSVDSEASPLADCRPSRKDRTTSVYRTRILVAAISFATSTTGALAEECDAPCIDFAFSSELQADWVTVTTPAGADGIDIQPTIDLETIVRATDRLSFTGVLTVESVTDWEPGTDRAFDGLGAYVSAVYGDFETEGLSLRFGKSDPDFGYASPNIEGLYSGDLVGDYDTDERWGVQLIVPFQSDLLSHAVTLNAYTTDRTVLNRSIGTRRESLSLADGGPGNVDGIGSVGIFYDICAGSPPADCFGDGDFGLRFGVRYQKAGMPTEEQIDEGITPSDETGYLIAGSRRFEIGDGTEARLLAEAALFRNHESNPDDALYLTGAVAIERGPLTYSAAYSRLSYLTESAPDTNDELFALGVRFEPTGDNGTFDADWAVEVGYAYNHSAEGDSDHKVGILLSIEF